MIKLKNVFYLPGFQKDNFDRFEISRVIKSFLESDGWKVNVSNYGNDRPMNLPIWIYLEEAACELKKQKPDVIIAHSFGGIIARYLIEIKNVSVDKLVMLETPHNGVPMIFMRLLGYPNWPAVRVILKGSPFLSFLNSKFLERGVGSHYYQIGGLYTTLAHQFFDLPGVRKKVFPLVSHSNLHNDPHVLAEISRFLNE